MADDHGTVAAAGISRDIDFDCALGRVTPPLSARHDARMTNRYPELSLYIDGEWLGADGRRSQPVINPATEDVLAQLPHASPADLDRALAAAQRAWPEW